MRKQAIVGIMTPRVDAQSGCLGGIMGTGADAQSQTRPPPPGQMRNVVPGGFRDPGMYAQTGSCGGPCRVDA